MKKIVFIGCMYLLAAIGIYAAEKGDIALTVNVPEQLFLGEEFELVYTINHKDAKNFNLPEIAGLKILKGPAVSSSYTSKSVGGKQTNIHTTSFTYTVCPVAKGKLILLPATVQIDEDVYNSNIYTVNVVSPDREVTEKSNRIHNSPSKITFTVSAPEKVKVGETFRLQYTVNVDIKNFKAPAVSDLEILMGPSKSTSTVHRNDQLEETTITYIYIVQAKKAGKITVPAATIEVDKQTIKSNTVTIQVEEEKTNTSTHKVV